MTETTQGSRRLGRGLEVLLGPSGALDERVREHAPLELRVDEIEPNPFQPRHDIEESALAELIASIRTSGLLQPVVVRQRVDGRHELIAGERRWRACRALGWTSIPAVRRDVDDRTLLTLALVENLQRDSLSPVDEAQGYRRLTEEFKLSQEDVAAAVGRDRSTVANALRLLKLPAPVLMMVHRGEFGVGHARALLSLQGKDAREITQLAREAVARGWSVREMEDEARAGRRPVRRGRRARGTEGRAIPPEVLRIEDALRRRLQTDVRVALRGQGKGRLHIVFYSQEDLARVLELILGEPYNG